MTEDGRIRVLIVCNWPVGGIRTYLRYVLPRLQCEEIALTLIARTTPERRQLEADLAAAGVRIIWVESPAACVLRVTSELATGRYDLVNSQGFLSAFYTSIPNTVFRKPHVLTIHGILEERYLSGRLAPFRMFLLTQGLHNVSVFLGVGHEILAHVRHQARWSASKRARWIVIQNGIDVAEFQAAQPVSRRQVLQTLGVEDHIVLFGFFGRFMPQKGFDLIVAALSRLQDTALVDRFRVLAVGSDDYVREAKALVEASGMSTRVIFQPRQASIAPFLWACDAVLMPSRWEAYSLVAAECLCAGVPLIASTCIGLREVIDGTPALAIPPEDPAALSKAMMEVVANPEIPASANNYREVARARYDVSRTVRELSSLFRQVAGRGTRDTCTESQS